MENGTDTRKASNQTLEGYPISASYRCVEEIPDDYHRDYMIPIF